MMLRHIDVPSYEVLEHSLVKSDACNGGRILDSRLPLEPSGLEICQYPQSRQRAPAIQHPH